MEYCIVKNEVCRTKKNNVHTSLLNPLGAMGQLVRLAVIIN